MKSLLGESQSAKVIKESGNDLLKAAHIIMSNTKKVKEAKGV